MRDLPRPCITVEDVSEDTTGPSRITDNQIRAGWEEGLSLREIGAPFDISRQAVSERMGTLGLKQLGARERRASWLFEHRGKEIRESFLRLRDDSAVAESLGLHQAEVVRVVNEIVEDPKVLRARPRSRQPRYSDQELRSLLRAVPEVRERPLTHDAYNEWAAGQSFPDARPYPGHQTMALRWGSWRAALLAADLPANPRSGPTSALSRQTAVAGVVSCWRELNHPPTVGQYDLWSPSHAAPASASVRKFVDGWHDALLSAWEVIHSTRLIRNDLPGVDMVEVDPEDPAEIRGLFTLEPSPARAPSPETAGVGYRRADEGVQPEAAALAAPDPESVTTALRAHARLQNSAADAIQRAGLVPLSPDTDGPRFDLAWRAGDGALTLCEVKSASKSNLEGQMRAAVAQALRYGIQAEHHLGERIASTIYVEIEPDLQWIELCRRLGINLVWHPNVANLVPERPRS